MSISIISFTHIYLGVVMSRVHFLILAFITAFSWSVFASSLPDQPYVFVTGVASLQVSPDQVMIKFQAKALDKHAKKAKAEVDKQVEALMVNLQQAGFSLEALQRADLYTGAEYNYDKQKRSLIGIRATRDLTYLLTDLNKVNELLDVVLDSGIESISSLEYGLQAPKKWQLKVREMAIADSKEKSSFLAKAYHAELGKIHSINYQNSHARPMMMRSMQDERAKTTYQAKQIKLTDRVETVYLLIAQ